MKSFLSLTPITDSDIQTTINSFKQSEDSFTDQIKIVVVFYRLGHYKKETFDYFFKFLRKYATKKHLELLYHELKAYLTEQYRNSPYRELYNYLNSRKYFKTQIETLSMSDEEKAFANSLPTDIKFLAILIFFLFDPKNTRHFFENKVIRPPSNEEIELLQLFNDLDDEHKRRIIKRMKKYLSKQ